jgi:hypothetical protein
MMKLTPHLLMNLTFLMALAATAHGAFAGEASPIFGSDGAPPFQLSVDPITGKPLILASTR